MNGSRPSFCMAAQTVPAGQEPLSATVPAGDEPLAADACVDLSAERASAGVDEILDALDAELVGLAGVKTRIRELAALLLIDRVRARFGLSAEPPSLHMCFTGNPGTGKTTVALRMAELLHRLGYLHRGQVVSVTRDDLVGQYVGHTAPKTKEVLKRALGGVLFIDEAYYLYRAENERDYGQETIEILLQFMENHRDDLVVILAGYHDRMEAFFASNPGMSSRIAHHLEFPDYTLDELAAIGDLMLREQRYLLGDEAAVVFRDYLARRMSQPRFANARSVRNALERARLRHAGRLVAAHGLLGMDDFMRLDAADFLASRVFSAPVQLLDLRTITVVEYEARSSDGASTLCPVMVGRDREFAQLQQAWRAGGQMLVVRGRAGIGKSRLVRELADFARGARGTVLAGRCSPTAGDVPFRPLREALLAAARVGRRPSPRLAAFRPALGSLVPEWSTEHAGGADGGLIVLAEGVLRLMAEWSSPDAPALLVIEDVHWADRETLEVIEYLADHVPGQPALIVATLRDDEPGPGSDLVSALWARRAVHPIPLSPLDPAQSEVMLRECLSAASLLPRLVDAVVARSDGVPFFIEELLATALGEANSARAVPGSVAAAVDARLGLLPEETARFLGFAAMLGRSFDWHVAAAAAGCPPQEAIGTLRQAARAQLIDADGDGFRFRHALTAEAVRSSLLPEERRAICASLEDALQLLHPDLEGETCQLAASLAAEAGDQVRAADLWLKAARRAMREGSLGSAEALAIRAQGARREEADRVLLSIWTIAGQPRRAHEIGQRFLSASDRDPAVRTEVLFELVDAMITAGQWDNAEYYLQALRAGPALDRPGAARLAIGKAEVALARNDSAEAAASARAALADARDHGLAELTCRALWVIGRVERGRDTDVARAAFEEAYECASRNALPVFRIKSLQELGTIDMFETLSTARLDEARREALAAGAISMVAMVDLQLAATYSARGQAGLTLAAGARCEEASRRFGLASLPASLALQAVAHGFSGNRAAMDAFAAQARALDGDHDTVEMSTLANGEALYHLGEGRLPEALDAMDRAVKVLRSAGAAQDWTGRWALLRTVCDVDGAQARDECRRLSFDTAMSRATLKVADAVAAGRDGADAGSIFTAADRALARLESGFTRSLARLLAAPCAHDDGWGSPAVWVREALADFEDLGLSNFAGQCRAVLRAMGEPVPRRHRSEAARVTGLLAAQGVTPREAEVLAQIAAGRSNREIAAALHLSVRTVEKHVERLLMKTGHSRSEMARFAEGAGIQPAV